MRVSTFDRIMKTCYWAALCAEMAHYTVENYIAHGWYAAAFGLTGALLTSLIIYAALNRCLRKVYLANYRDQVTPKIPR